MHGSLKLNEVLLTSSCLLSNGSLKLNEALLTSPCFAAVELFVVLDLGCRLLRQNATKFLMDDVYRNPGPLQFDGSGADAKPVTLCVEDQDYMGRIKELQKYLDKVLQNLHVLYPPSVIPPAPPCPRHPRTHSLKSTVMCSTDGL